MIFYSYQRGKPILGKLSGARTENSHLMGILCPFFVEQHAHLFKIGQAVLFNRSNT